MRKKIDILWTPIRILENSDFKFPTILRHDALKIRRLGIS